MKRSKHIINYKPTLSDIKFLNAFHEICLFFFHFQTTKLLEEKDDHIEKLQERIQMLEQRFQDQNLVGDDRVQALENEVKRLG